jgi:DNA-binding transcriptional LysR family regulator
MTHSSKSLPALEGLNALLAAAEGGSFSAAAEMLGVTHGSVSRRVAALEAWLGTPLFERHGRGVRLTPAGTRFAADARHTLSALARNAELWRPWKDRETVTLTVTPSFCRLWLLSRLTELERDDLYINLVLEHRTANLETREADIAIRYGEGAWDGIDSRLLFSETHVPIAHPDIAAELGPDAPPAEMLRFPLLHNSNISQWRAWLACGGVDYQPRWLDRRFEDYDTVLAAAERGLGIALCRQPLATGWPTLGRLIPVSRRGEPYSAAYFVCTRPGESRTSVVKLADRIHQATGSNQT